MDKLIQKTLKEELSDAVNRLYKVNASISINVCFQKGMTVKEVSTMNHELGSIIKQLRKLEGL